MTPHVFFTPISQLEYFVQDLKTSNAPDCIVKLTQAVAFNRIEHLQALIHEKDQSLNLCKFLLLNITLQHQSIPLALEIMGIVQELNMSAYERSLTLINLSKLHDRSKLPALLSPLITSGPITQEALDASFLAFTQGRDNECLKTMLSSYKFSKHMYETAAFQAARMGYMDTLEVLIKHVSFSQEFLNFLMIELIEQSFSERLFLYFNQVPRDIKNPHERIIYFIHLLSGLAYFDFKSLLAHTEISLTLPKQSLSEKLSQYLGPQLQVLGQDHFLSIYTTYLHICKENIIYYTNLQSGRGALCLFSALSGNKDILELTLSLGPITASDRGYALLLAIEALQLECALKLISSGPVTAEQVKTAVCKSASYGLETTFFTLCEKQTVDTELLKEALITGSKAGQISFITKLMLKVKFGYQELLLATKEAFYLGHKALAHKIIMTHNHDPFFRNYVHNHATFYGWHELIDYLREKNVL